MVDVFHELATTDSSIAIALDSQNNSVLHYLPELVRNISVTSFIIEGGIRTIHLKIPEVQILSLLSVTHGTVYITVCVIISSRRHKPVWQV